MKKIALSFLALTAMAFSSGASHNECPKWGYTGENSPEKWGALSEKFRSCGTGLNQSPINITHSLHANLPPLSPQYRSGSRTIEDNGHTIQVNMDSGSFVRVDGGVYELRQFHFHTPSENHIDGKEFPLEGHFVNVDNFGNLVVLSVMFEYGAQNQALAKIWENMPTEEGQSRDFDVPNIAALLLPMDRHYYRFNGSLTTPPCTEGVRWFVFKESLTVSKEQVERFKEVMHGCNNRPVQPLDARIIVD